MARYAALCQEAWVVPIVEPEILMDGDHDLALVSEPPDTSTRCTRVAPSASTSRDPLEGEHGRARHGGPIQDDDAMIADRDDRTLTSHVPAEVPGVVFLSGGMSDEQATSRLTRRCTIRGLRPWGTLSFSRSRVAGPLVQGLGGRGRQRRGGQGALSHRARMNGLARAGRTAGLEGSAA